MKKYIVMLSVLAAVGCKKDAETINADPQKETIHNAETPPAASDDIVAETFSFPKELNGCSCYFSKNKADFEAQKFVYADDFQNTAFVKLNGKDIKLNLTSGNGTEDETTVQKDAENADYKVSVKLKRLDRDEELMIYEGEMTVVGAQGNTTTVPLYGECGC